MAETAVGGLRGSIGKRFEKSLVCQILTFDGVIKGLVELLKRTRTIRVPSFPLTDTLAPSLDGLHSAGTLEILN